MVIFAWLIGGYLLIGLFFGRQIAKKTAPTYIDHEEMKRIRREMQKEGSLLNRAAKLEGLDGCYISNDHLKRSTLAIAWWAWGLFALTSAIKTLTAILEAKTADIEEKRRIKKTQKSDS